MALFWFILQFVNGEMLSDHILVKVQNSVVAAVVSKQFMEFCALLFFS